MALGYPGRGDVGGSPCGLEVESTGDAVDVDTLADEIKPRYRPAFHGLEIDGRALDSTCGDELVLVGRFALSLKSCGFQCKD